MTQILLAHATSTEWSAIALAFAGGTLFGGLTVAGVAFGARFLRR